MRVHLLAVWGAQGERPGEQIAGHQGDRVGVAAVIGVREDVLLADVVTGDRVVYDGVLDDAGVCGTQLHRVDAGRRRRRDDERVLSSSGGERRCDGAQWCTGPAAASELR